MVFFGKILKKQIQNSAKKFPISKRSDSQLVVAKRYSKIFKNLSKIKNSAKNSASRLDNAFCVKKDIKISQYK